MKPIKNFIISFFPLLFLAGCASFNKQPSQSIERMALVWLNQSMDIEVDKVNAGEFSLYIRFKAFHKDSDQARIFQARTVWDAEENRLARHSRLLPLQLEFIPKDVYERKSATLDPVKVLDQSRWFDIRKQLVERLVSDERFSGIQIPLNGMDFILYRDDQLKAHLIPLNEIPDTVEIQSVFSEEQLAESLLETMQAYLETHSLKENRVLLTTGDEVDMMQPFLFFDLSTKQVIQLRINEQADERYREWIVKKGWKSADRLIVDSYIIGMPTRPVSSAYRLLAWTKDTAYGTFRPDKISFFDDKEMAPLSDGPAMDLELWEKELDKIVDKNSNTGTMEYLIGGEEYFPDQVEAFLNAKKSILVRIFIFDNDDYAVKIADILKKKSLEGVEVKVLLDGMGVVMGEGKISETMPAGFAPPSSMVDYLQEDSNIEVRVRPNAWFKADHTKTIVIDDQICYTGGMNIGREYRYDWHDMMIKLQGPVLNEILREFDLAWEHAGRLGDLAYLKTLLTKRSPIDVEGGYPIRLLYTQVNDAQIFKAQLEAIKRSQKYIYISNAYFSDNSIIQELVRARRRGVDVRIILPVHGNHEIMNKNNVVTANYLFQNGIRVFFYPGMSHIKAAVYDGWLCTGSANFDKLSFRDNLELNVATSNPEASEAILKQLFYPDFKKSKEMTKPLDYGLKERLAELIAEQL